MEMDQQELVDSLVKEHAAINKLAASILEDKHQMVDLDHRRNKLREALRQLKIAQTNHKKESWMCVGNTFLKLDSGTQEKLLIKDGETLENEITKLREGLKPKVQQLHKMEGAAELKGFELKGMRIEEILNVKGSDLN